MDKKTSFAMNLTPYPKPTCCQRAKIAFHYLLPQLAVTRLAGWFAEKEWGGTTHFVIKQFARAYKINWDEAKKSQATDFKTFNEFFHPRIKRWRAPHCFRQPPISPASRWARERMWQHQR
nr:hypothetical protein [Alysiella crassa]UOP08120.1 hypothetical protein LVJ80_07415 [Alysiella crassa]